MNVFDLFAVIKLDDKDYRQRVQEDSEEGKTLASKLGGVMSGLGKAAVAGVAAAGTAAVTLGKQSLEAYANYEQLVGGVETLFAPKQGLNEFIAEMQEVGVSAQDAIYRYNEMSSASDEVLKNAQQAYKTAGLSANEYMETVTSFSASLLQSLGGDTAKAADYADMAIRDMSDNANKMGSDMSSIQAAYQGFAKQNYTMLDNLKLGYGGTKSEMERLILDAENLNASFHAARDENGNLAMSYADIVDAIHIVQTDMGITGTTAEEASSTISGSVASMKAAWQNMLVGIADENADFETLTEDFVDSVVTVGENIIPRVQTIIQGLGTLISQASDKLVPMVVKTITDNLPSVIESGIKLVMTLITGLIQAIPQLVASIPQIIQAIVNGLVSAWPEIKQAGMDLVRMIGDGISNLASEAWNWGADIIGNLIDGIKAWAGRLWDEVKNVAQGIRNFLGFSEPEEGPLSNFHTYAPDMMQLFAKGIRDNEHLVTDQIADSFDFQSEISPVFSGKSEASGVSAGNDGIIKIIAQVVLDKKVIGQAAYEYQRGIVRAVG